VPDAADPTAIDVADPTLRGEDLEIRGRWLKMLGGEQAGTFIESTASMERLLEVEIQTRGHASLLAHLRLCGVIPESFEHDSTPEKLYSKYTDAVLGQTFRFLGMRSIVLAGRADCADVEAVSIGLDEDYDLVADAKAFRLSRTAKNAKDFKVSSMNRWKYGKRFGIVVAPIFQLPSVNSQIYEQAISYDIAVLSYSHLATLVNYVAQAGGNGQRALLRVLETTTLAQPSKSAVAYWTAINRSFLDADRGSLPELWSLEKRANLETIKHAKEEALTHLASERARIMRMSHAETVALLINMKKITAREAFIRQLSDNHLLGH
jgi:type II restriction enzyme